MITKTDTLEFKNPTGFLVLDGANGAGKTTLQDKILAYVQEKGFETVKTREPGATKIGKDLRRILLESEEKLSEKAEMFLFSADRTEHIDKLIKPALKENKLVVSDRYYYSTTAFQGYGRRQDLEMVEKINSIAVGDALPDLVLILDIDPVEGLNRTSKRASEEADNFEKEQIDFHHRLREGFLKMADTYQESFLIVNASPSAEEVWLSVKPAIDKWVEALNER